METVIMSESCIKNKAGYMDLSAEIKDDDFIITAENQEGDTWETKCNIDHVLNCILGITETGIVTKEMVDVYLELHDKITDRLYNVLDVLSKINPIWYSKIPLGYYNPDPDSFEVCNYTNYYGFESESVPTKYLYDNDWLEQEKQKLKEKEERQRQEQILRELQLEKEIKEKMEYERLKKKFEKGE